MIWPLRRLLCPAPWGGDICIDGRCPSVCLSVCPVLDPKSRMESRIASWKLAGRKPGDPLTPISSSKGQTLAGMGEILATRSLCVLHGHNERLEYTIMTAKLNALGGCSKHHLQGGGAWNMWRPTTGRSAC